tara:strand:+ start:130 stop:423 length:294 start_codon:yes stop_codon:yes gene_type:complete
MSRKLTLPFFPSAPEEYAQQYMAEIVRLFSLYVTQMQNPGEGRNTSLVLTNLQDHDRGLEVGELFEQDGFIKITKSTVPHPQGLSGAASVGSVSVTV